MGAAYFVATTGEEQVQLMVKKSWQSAEQNDACICYSCQNSDVTISLDDTMALRLSRNQLLHGPETFPVPFLGSYLCVLCLF